MEITTHYALAPGHLALAVGALALPASAELQVDFVYDAGYPDCLTEANGDPGEPGLAESFDFKRILTTAPLVLSDEMGEVLLVIRGGVDLHDYLDRDTLAAIEIAALRELRAREAQGRIDAYLEARDD